MQKHILALGILLALLVAPVLAYAQDGVVPLEYDYGGDLQPGHRIVFRLHSLGHAEGLGAFADSGVQIGSLKWGIIGDDGPIPIHVRWLVPDDQGEFDSIWVGYKEYDATLTLTAYCIGETPSGAPGAPPDGYIWVHAVFNGPWGTRTGWYLVDAQDTAPRIQLFYEKGTAFGITLQSWVQIQDDIQWKNCGHLPGNNPNEGHDTRNDNDDGFNLPWKWLGLAVVILLIILLIKL